jgi:two-component system, NtrC family, sensor kinase
MHSFQSSMKFAFLLFVFIEVSVVGIYGQTLNVDSLIRTVDESLKDTATLQRILLHSNNISFNDPTSALKLDRKVIDIARQMHYPRIEMEALNSAAEDNHFLGNYADALKMQFEALQINRHMKDPAGEGETLGLIGILYNELSEYRQALGYLIPADSIFQKIPGIYEGCFVLANMGDAYDSLKMADSALYYIRESYYKYAETDRPHLKSFILSHMGSIYAQFGKDDSALYFYNRSLLNSRISNDQLNTAMSLRKIADVYTNRRMYDSAIFYARQSFETARRVPSNLHLLKASDLLAVLYTKTHNSDSVLFYLQTAAALKERLYGPDKIHKLQVLLLDEQQRQYSVIQHEQEFRNLIKYILLIAALAVILIVAFILLRLNRVKQKANNLLIQQKEKIEETLTELKSTQSLLIQSEKMASLGELTAGIAHEIQNPLNFINNFSDVNKELIEEMESEIDKGNIDNLKSIATDIKDNEEKISHHGKRADDIVKGMLQHSRKSTGHKESTNINALADEYLRLAYHGLRAKDKSFNVNLQTDFDPTIGKINLIPQDVGRVLLNLYNNAFYSVTEKKQQQPDAYEPTVSVNTKKAGDDVLISVRDNGCGIPQKIIDKIFQPFFTTKPSGQGTGLGLSISYDIIKAHGGEITVDTKEGDYTEFVIRMPAL